MSYLQFPPHNLADPDGLLAVGGDLSLEGLLSAYEYGVFPWPISPEYPLTWFSPDPRGILHINNLHISASLKKFIKKSNYKIYLNRDFAGVINHCANTKRPGQESTWITDEIKESYINLFNHHYAYSIEAYEDDQLIGGVYGVNIFGFTSGESMFYLKTNASKICLLYLLLYAPNRWIDTQMITPVVKSLGGIEIPRDKFLIMHKDTILDNRGQSSLATILNKDITLAPQELLSKLTTKSSLF